MSRSGYTEDGDYDFDQWSFIRWRGQVASAIRGKRGQAFLKELVEALDALPEKRLILHELYAGGQVCALGSLGVKRGVEMESLDPEDYNTLGNVFEIAHQLVQEIEWVNDDAYYNATPEQRWEHMRAWIVSLIKAA